MKVRSDSNHQGATPRPTVGARKRVAMLSWAFYGICTSVLALAMVERLVPLTPSQVIFVDTLWWSVGAFIATTLLIDRFIHVPAAEGGIWVVFSSAASFASLLVVFGATHSSYSRAALAGAFVLVTVWLFIGIRTHLRSLVLHLGVPEPAVLALLSSAREALRDAPLTHVQAELVYTRGVNELMSLDGVVIDRYSEKSEELRRIITILKLGGVRIYSADHIHEILTGRLALSHTEDSFLDDSSGGVIYVVIKRMLDVLGASALLIILCVPMLALAIALRIENGDRALFVQERVGRGGRLFRMIKFCTMRPAVSDVPDADALSSTPSSTHSLIRSSRQHDDLRVTKLGRLLRRYRLDELPQLFNVLAGTMSLIGPRPEWITTATDFFERIPHYPYRHLVRPGITGWAQVNQGHVTDLPDAMIKLELDLFYVKHMSFALDLVIGIRTLRTVTTGHGAR